LPLNTWIWLKLDQFQVNFSPSEQLQNKNSTMTKRCQIIKNQSQEPLIQQAKWCTSFLCKLKGFMFRRSIEQDEALIFVHRRDNRINTSIHMFFVPFDLGVIWVNKTGKVVDLVCAKPWRPSYAPKEPASYVIELHPDKLGSVAIGDSIEFNHLPVV
jgi:uncharacterized membrane protein (UPF0127 family)